MPAPASPRTRPMQPCWAPLSLALCALSPTAAMADALPSPATPAAAATATAMELAAADTIIVTGYRTGYVVSGIGTATRTPTPLLDVPQAISVISRDQIDDQAIRSIAEIVRNVPGATIGLGEGNRDQVVLRGNNTTADFFIDGVRDDVQYYRGLYNVERVEVLKGPNAAIFGRGGGGGVINRVSKTPQQRRFAALNLSVDSFSAWAAETDLNAPLADRLQGRLNAVYESLDSHRDVYGGHRFAFNPTLALDLTPATRLDLSYEYAEDDRVADRGIPSRDGRPLEGVRDRFFGARGVNNSHFRGHIARGRIEHKVGEDLTLRSTLLYGDYAKSYRNAFPATPVSGAPGFETLGVEAYFDQTERRNLFSQSDLVWRVATGPVAHVLLAGVEYGDQRSDSRRTNGFFDASTGTSNDRRRVIVALTDPFDIPPIRFRAGPGNRRVHSQANIFSAFAQDQIAFGDHVDLIAGVRFDQFKLRIDDRLANPPSSVARTDRLVSPRAGLVIKPVEPLSFYASYTRSFLPQSGDQFLSLDASLATLEPERFVNTETGVKWNITPAFNATVAVYRLIRKNTRAAGPTPGTVVLTGEQRSRGLELSLTGKPRPDLQLALGYALQDARLRSATTAGPAGRHVALTPKHTVSAWSRYDITPRVGLGLGIYRQGRSFANISNAVTLPAYVRVDLAGYLKLTDQLDAQVNIENITNKRYFPTAHTDNNIATGAPLSARFTLRARY